MPVIGNARILLVDDTAVNRFTVRAVLEELGHEIVECSSGEEAVQQTENGEFAVILLDVRMQGIDGFETAQLIRRQRRSRHIPIIFLTALEPDPAQLDRAYKLGAVDFLSKPLRPLMLRAKVQGFADLFLEKRRVETEAEQHRMLVQGTADYAIFLLDSDGKILTWNLGAERLKGYTTAEIVGSHFSRFYSQVDIDRGWPTHELEVAAKVGRFEDEGWRLRKNGTQFWANVVITALRDEFGNLRGFSKVTRDLTARREAEEALRRSEERFRLLVEGAKDYAIFHLDNEGRVASWNTGAERITGYSAAEIVGQHFSCFYPPKDIDDAWPARTLALAAEEGSFEDDGWKIKKDGSRIWANVVITALRDDAASLRGFSIITRDITEKKLAEETALRLMEERTARRVAENNSRLLEEQRERLHVTLSSIGDAVISTDANGVVEFLNPVAENLIGINEDEAKDQPIAKIFKIINETTREPVENPALKALKEGRTVGLANHTVLIAKEGKEIFIDDSAAPIKNRLGETIGSVLVFRDIGEKRQTDRILRENELRLRLALSAGQMQVWDWEVHRGRLNEGADSSLSFGAVDQFLSQFDLVMHADDRIRSVQAIEQAVRNEEGFEFEFRALSPERQTRWLLVKGTLVSEPDSPTGRIVGIAIDITKRKRIEQTSRFLAEASAALAILFDFESIVQKLASLAVPFLADWATVDLVDEEGNIRQIALAPLKPEEVGATSGNPPMFPLEINKIFGLEGMLQTGKAELIPDIVRDLPDSANRRSDVAMAISRWGLTSYLGVPLKVRGKILGVLRLISAKSGRVYDHHDLLTAQDLAERGAVAIENARLYREIQDQDRRKDEFLATLAHELRNPLSPIRNSIQILKMPRVTEEIARQTREMMDRQVDYLTRLVDDLLDVSRVMRGKIDLRKEPTEMSTLIARGIETVATFIDQQGITVEISVPEASLLLDVDPVRGVQIISNLLTNAAKYNQPGGQIWISAKRDGNRATLMIRDNGIGIASSLLPHVFELFVQADHALTKAQGGLGIGLTLVRNLVEMHGGSVKATSAGLGQGSEFAVTFPLLLSDSSTEVVEQRQVDDAPRAAHLRLAVVDDNRDAATSLAVLLRLQGHEVQVAYDGHTAIAIAEKFHPHLMFLDIGMPGMDGYEVARRLRLLRGQERLVVVALTGWGQEQDRRRTAEAGFDHHLVKPPDLKALEAILSLTIERMN